MAKDFGKMNKGKIKAIANKSNTMANVVSVKMIHTDDLIDCPDNNEDLSYTEDVEASINESGFVDAIIVTNCGCEDGKYMILSGHRRRVAGVKLGIKTFPCVVRHFKDYASAVLYCKMGNITRPQTPTLLAIRYKGIEEALKLNGFQGNMREEIAKRMGVSVQQADRYNQLNKIILPVWDMINEDKVGMSSVLPLSSFTTEQQAEIVDIFEECMRAGKRLSREVCKELINNYKAGKKTYSEMIEMVNEKDSDSSAETSSMIRASFLNTQSAEESKREDESGNRRDEINYDTSHREGLENQKDNFSDEKLTEEDKEVIEQVSNQNRDKKEQLTEEEKNLKRGTDLANALDRVEKLLGEHYSYSCKQQTVSIMHKITNCAKMLNDGLQYLSMQYENDDEVQASFKHLVNSLMKDLNSYIEE